MSESTHNAFSKQVQKVTAALLSSGAWKATLFASPTQVVRATRRWHRHTKKQSASRIEVVVTIGRPNYQEQPIAKTFKKAGEPFPVKKVQLKFRKTA